jgi:hypothetical protein
MSMLVGKRERASKDDRLSHNGVVTRDVYDIFLTYLGELLLEYSQDELLHFASELSFLRPGSFETDN